MSKKLEYNSHYMKKIIVGIFAHPDDEAFGPGGTLAVLSKENNVYIICATSGESATGTYDKKLGEERQKELRASCKILGVKEVFFLGFVDGTLSNSLYHEIAGKIETILKKLKPQILLTFEPQGVSGHLDHIAMSMITSFVARKIPSVKEVWYYGISDRFHKLRNRLQYFIYFPKGYPRKAFNKIINVKDVWETKVQAMKQHQTQIADINRILLFQHLVPKEECFIVKKVKDL